MLDIHCHLDHPLLTANIPNYVSASITTLTCGIKPTSWVDNLKIAREFELPFCLGVHPFFAENPEYANLELLESYLKNSKVFAIGEIGLDYNKPQIHSKQAQLLTFKKQLTLAETYKLPVLIHCRKAFSDFWELVKPYSMPMIHHAFSGSENDLKLVIKRGDYVSYGFPITYENNNKQVSLLKQTPLENLFLETDSPYMKRAHQLPAEYSSPSDIGLVYAKACLLYTSPSPRDRQKSRMPSSA